MRFFWPGFTSARDIPLHRREEVLAGAQRGAVDPVAGAGVDRLEVEDDPPARPPGRHVELPRHRHGPVPGKVETLLLPLARHPQRLPARAGQGLLVGTGQRFGMDLPDAVERLLEHVQPRNRGGARPVADGLERQLGGRDRRPGRRLALARGEADTRLQPGEGLAAEMEEAVGAGRRRGMSDRRTGVEQPDGRRPGPGRRPGRAPGPRGRRPARRGPRSGSSGARAGRRPTAPRSRPWRSPRRGCGAPGPWHRRASPPAGTCTTTRVAFAFGNSRGPCSSTPSAHRLWTRL